MEPYNRSDKLKINNKLHNAMSFAYIIYKEIKNNKRKTRNKE